MNQGETQNLTQGAMAAEKFRILFFALVFGFSQDAFLKRLLTTGVPLTDSQA